MGCNVSFVTITVLDEVCTDYNEWPYQMKYIIRKTNLLALCCCVIMTYKSKKHVVMMVHLLCAQLLTFNLHKFYEKCIFLHFFCYYWNNLISFIVTEEQLILSFLLVASLYNNCLFHIVYAANGGSCVISAHLVLLWPWSFSFHLFFSQIEMP